MKMYIFVRNDLKMSKGKIAGQVGHVCMRIGYRLGQWGCEEIMTKYVECGEKKIVFKVAELPYDYYPNNANREDAEGGGYDLNDPAWFCKSKNQDYDQDYDIVICWVKDNTLQEFTTMAILTDKEIDTSNYKLL